MPYTYHVRKFFRNGISATCNQSFNFLSAVHLFATFFLLPEYQPSYALVHVSSLRKVNAFYKHTNQYANKSYKKGPHQANFQCSKASTMRLIYTLTFTNNLNEIFLRWRNRLWSWNRPNRWSSLHGWNRYVCSFWTTDFRHVSIRTTSMFLSRVNKILRPSTIRNSFACPCNFRNIVPLAYRFCVKNPSNIFNGSQHVKWRKKQNFGWDKQWEHYASKTNSVRWIFLYERLGLDSENTAMGLFWSKRQLFAPFRKAKMSNFDSFWRFQPTGNDMIQPLWRLECSDPSLYHCCDSEITFRAPEGGEVREHHW